MRTSAKFTLLAAVAAVASGLTATTALGTQGHVAAAARQYTLTIRGVDRNGKRVAIEPTVFGATNGHDYLTYLSKVTVPACQYVVAAPITAAADHGNQTLVAKVVRVRSNTTVTLSAVGAVPVRATLNVPAGVTQRNQSVMLCVKGAGRLNGVTGLLVPVGMSKGVITPGTVYVKPMTGSGLRFVYQTYWTEPSLLQVYDEAAAYNGGIPAHPSYSQRLGGLAHVNVELRANENSAPLRNVIETYDGCGSLTLPEYNLPESYTDDRTPGTWLTGLAFGPSGTTITREIDKTSAYSAGLQLPRHSRQRGGGAGRGLPGDERLGHHVRGGRLLRRPAPARRPRLRGQRPGDTGPRDRDRQFRPGRAVREERHVPREGHQGRLVHADREPQPGLLAAKSETFCPPPSRSRGGSTTSRAPAARRRHRSRSRSSARRTWTRRTTPRTARPRRCRSWSGAAAGRRWRPRGTR